MFFHCPDPLQLLDDSREGIGDDGDHDKEGEDEDDDGGHDQLDISAGNTSVLLNTILASKCLSRQDRPRVLVGKSRDI